MSGLQLYTYPNNFNAHKALIAAKFGEVEIELPAFQLGKDNKQPDFLGLFPPGKVSHDAVQATLSQKRRKMIS